MIHVKYMPPSIGFRMANEETIGPKADIAETGSDYVLNLEIPGTFKEDVKVWVDGDILMISGEKKAPNADGSKLLVSERDFGKFERAFILPEHVERNNISAQFVDGLLVITVPKSINAKPREISIN